MASSAVALLVVAFSAACAAQPQPSGTWVRRHDIFFCDWEGGHNQGSLSFANNGYFSERFNFDGDGKTFSTSASGRWSIQGETLTVDLDKSAGRGEEAPASQRMRLLFTAAQQSSALQLTLTKVVHEDSNQPKREIEVPNDERCTVVYERPAAKPRRWRNALAALGLRSKAAPPTLNDG